MIEEELEGLVVCHVVAGNAFIFVFCCDRLSFLDLEKTTRWLKQG